MLVKVHEAYRKIITVCDSNLLGKRFEEGNMQLEIKESFYGGRDFKEAKVLKILEDAKKEDACFNIVGQESIGVAIKAKVIDEGAILNIAGIPHALSLL